MVTIVADLGYQNTDLDMIGDRLTSKWIGIPTVSTTEFVIVTDDSVAPDFANGKYYHIPRAIKFTGNFNVVELGKPGQPTGTTVFGDAALNPYGVYGTITAIQLGGMSYKDERGAIQVAIGNGVVISGLSINTSSLSISNSNSFADAVLKGNDLIKGLYRVDAGAGNDTIYGGPANSGGDSIRGGAGNDLFNPHAEAHRNYWDHPNPFGNPSYYYGEDGNDTINGTWHSDDFIEGGAGDDVLNGFAANDKIYGGPGNDTIDSGSGVDTVDGGDGIDTIIFHKASTDYTIEKLADGAYRISDKYMGVWNNDVIKNIEYLKFSDKVLSMDSALAELPAASPSAKPKFLRHVNGKGEEFEPTPIAKPYGNLKYEYFGSADNEVVIAMDDNDFLNGYGGNDALEGRGGDDVIDGGAGSNFLIGGDGQDVFFVDGRGTEVVWSTVTDLQRGEWATMWGWRPGISTLKWVENDGADSSKGATAHCDLDGNGVTDSSFTFTGKASSAITSMAGKIEGQDYMAFTML